jgi:thiamine-monophosphate kinase
VSWNEDSLHHWLRARPVPAGLARGHGHDAAVLARPLRRPVVCTDQTVAGVHFEPGTPPARVGHKAAARALSDLAATGAEPRAVLASLALQADVDEAWVRAVLRAIGKAAAPASLVGGDLSGLPGRGDGAVVAVTALGDYPLRGAAPARDRARGGHVVVLTGPVGGSSLGRHLRIRPRLAEGAWLAAHGARAMMDTSDGLALDLSRLARASGVRIDLERVPIHRDARRLARRTGASALSHALADGEDHELLASFPAAAWKRVRAAATRRFPGLEVVGRVRAGRGLRVPSAEDGGELVPWEGLGGWVHGC